MRLKDPKITTAQEMAEAILPVVASKLYDCPWVLVAHSVGTWISYEFLMQCRAAGVPMPLVAFISAMPAPDIPVEDRPWRQQRTLNEEDFKARLLYTVSSVMSVHDGQLRFRRLSWS